jgi:membrane-bound serine protease (ClpP class)
MKYVILICFLFQSWLVSAQKVIAITVDGTINPASAGFINRNINKAEKERAQCLVIQLNTPGGLMKSTRVIVAHIMESSVPVVVYVSPGGAQAGSAGVFVTMSAHIAAMAPGTNIGAAHPVSQGTMDATMNEKITNDAVAFIRTIAEKRNRNAGWAEDAVRKSVSITSSDALQDKVIDLVATHIEDLLQQIDGRTIELSRGNATLQTAHAQIETSEMSFAEKILDIISDPNIGYILMMLGFYGVLFELYNPGSILPGIIGVIGLILAFYSMHTLPVNYAGLALIIFGIVLFLLEIKITSYGMLTIGGMVSLFLGSMMLLKPDSGFEFIQISRTVIIGTTLVSALFFLFVIGLGIRAQRARPTTGMEGFIGETGIALDTLAPSGNVRVHGEIWQAESGSGIIEQGEKVQVISMKNFKLLVAPKKTVN